MDIRHMEQGYKGQEQKKGIISEKHYCMTSSLLNQEKRTHNQYLMSPFFLDISA